MGISIATESISYLWDYMTERARRFPAPWTVEEHRGISYIVRDANNFAVAYVYFEEDQLLRTGVNLMNKDEARNRWGDEQVHLWQRSYDIAPPGGESLKDTAARVLPFYSKRITPELHAGKSVLLVGHGNSLRSLVMQLDRLSPEQVKELTISTGMPLIYRLRPDGTVAEKRDLAA